MFCFHLTHKNLFYSIMYQVEIIVVNRLLNLACQVTEIIAYFLRAVSV